MVRSFLFFPRPAEKPGRPRAKRLFAAAKAIFYGVDENLSRYIHWAVNSTRFRAGNCGNFPPERNAPKSCRQRKLRYFFAGGVFAAHTNPTVYSAGRRKQGEKQISPVESGANSSASIGYETKPRNTENPKLVSTPDVPIVSYTKLGPKVCNKYVKSIRKTGKMHGARGSKKV
jgi:hypothetical protein